MPAVYTHPQFARRTMLQAGAIGILGLGMNHIEALRALAANAPRRRAKSVIYIFLSGGLAQHESFDLKPSAPAEVRGEFKPISTKTPGIQICEHLPMLAERSDKWAVVRSLTHPYNEHSQGHLVMLSGRTPMSPGFKANSPTPTDWPSIAAIAGSVLPQANNLPPAAVLPDRIVHNSGRVIPGQFAGLMGPKRDPWFIEASPFHPKSYGAFPQYHFDHQERDDKDERIFQAPSLSLPQGLDPDRLGGRVKLLSELGRQRAELDHFAQTENFDRYRQGALSLLTDARVQSALDVTKADAKTQERYGANSFGWSLLMARRLIDLGVGLVQVNLGNNESWDTHGNAFPHLKEKLLPPTDRALSALIDDLSESGLLDDTLIVMGGEFGRTPRISTLPSHYKSPGRDHWGAVQSVFFAGGGVKGGQVIGSSDRLGGYPLNDPQTPENMAASIYHALGLPSTAVWRDESDRPHHIYHADPIRGLFA